MHRKQIRRRLTAAAAVALAVVAGLATTSTPAGAAAARRGPVPALPRSSVPWSRIGPGWFLTVDSTEGLCYCENPRPGTDSLLLVSPAGARYRLLAWAVDTDGDSGPGDLSAWSGDGKRALFVENETQTSTRVTELDLRSGAEHAFTTTTLASATYTRPKGAGLLLSHSGGLDPHPTTEIDRTTLTGTNPVRIARAGGTSLYSPDGTYLVLGTGTGLATVSNQGTALRTIAIPGAGCYPVRWWDARTVVAACTIAGEIGPGTLWLADVAAGTARQLTPDRTGSTFDFGDLDAWQLPSGLYLQSAGACGVIDITKQAADGSVRLVTVPGAAGKTVIVYGTYRGKLEIQVDDGCGAGLAIGLFDPAAEKVTKLLTRLPGTSGIGGTLPFPTSSTPGI